MNTDSPFEGDVPDDGDEPSYEWLDEWLCEYVDGTMDPSLEAVFEKYVEANPDLKAHIERLQETRELLCNCGAPRDAAPDVKAEVCREAECDLPEAPPGPERATAPERPIAAFGLVSSVAAALIVGFLIGAMVVGPLPSEQHTGTEAPNSVVSDPEPASAEPLVPARRSTTPVVTTDSANAPSPLTPIGMP
jgi:anti-sigma factor RsiW